jgi:hypothetical protein
VERVTEIPEKRLAASVHDRLNHDRVLIDEASPGQCLHELAPPQAMISPPGWSFSTLISSAIPPACPFGPTT